MSSPKPALVLSPEAKDDIEHILRNTAETWGHAQVMVYRAKLESAFATITEQPSIGHTVPELADIYRVYLVGSHVIVYRPQDQALWVVRVLHQRTSLPRHIDPQERDRDD